MKTRITNKRNLTIMTAVAIEQTYKSVSDLAGKFDVPKQKTSSVIQKVINVFSSEESLGDAQYMRTQLIDLKETFTGTEMDYEVAKTNLDKVSDILSRLNALLGFVKYIFDGEDDSKIIIDDNYFIDTMLALQQSQCELTYLYDYLSMVTKVKGAKEEDMIECTVDELKEFINAA